LVDERVVVIGAGPAGLAAAWAIGQAGLDPLVVEQADAVAASWRSRHDQLRLNTHRVFSHQPGARIPRRYGPFPARDDYVAYLERYAAGMRIRFGTAAGRIDRAGPGWKLTLGGGSISTAHAVVATGPDAEPAMPAWPGIWLASPGHSSMPGSSAALARWQAGMSLSSGRGTPAWTC
jgi:cation diffusion facilitator CzcD-associated flavoprotein CzcO